MSLLKLLTLSLMLSGCGVVGGMNYIGGSIDQMNARNSYVKSADHYRHCLATNPNGAQTCENLRLAMELDEKTLRQVSASHGGGANVNLNSQ